MSGATAEQTQVLLSFAPAAGVLAQAGRKKGGGENVEIGRLLGASLNSEGGLILTRLRGGRPAVNATNDLTVFAATPGGLIALVRTGQLILGKTVRSFSLLKSIPGAPAQGRGDSSAAGVRFLVRFTDQTQAIMETAEGGDFIARASTGGATDISGIGAYWSQFGPSLSSSLDGSRFAFRASTVAALNELAPATDGIFEGSATGFTRIVGAGDAVPNLAGNFAAFGEPVLSADGSSLAFLADLRAPQLRDRGVFAVRGDGPLVAIATLSGQPPDVAPGARWKTFVSLAAVGGGVGPVFHARLKLGGEITEANDAGLWAVDGNGVLRGVIREGDEIAGKRVKTIQALNAVKGLPGATRAFNSSQQMVWKATFTDKMSAIVLTTLP
jgi:hypothetical protein